MSIKSIVKSGSKMSKFNKWMPVVGVVTDVVEIGVTVYQSNNELKKDPNRNERKNFKDKLEIYKKMYKNGEISKDEYLKLVSSL